MMAQPMNLKRNLPLFGLIAVLVIGGVIIGQRLASDVPLARREMTTYLFIIFMAAALVFLGLRGLRARSLPREYVEYTLHAPGADGRLHTLIDRLRPTYTLELAALDEMGQPGGPPAPDARLLGSQVRLRLPRSPGHLTLRLRAEPDGRLFGMLEIADGGAMAERRLAAALLRELGRLVPHLAYKRAASSQLMPVGQIGSDELL